MALSTSSPSAPSSPSLPWREPVRRASMTTLQLNLGRYCNLACVHCHVESSPARNKPEEQMSDVVRAEVIAWIRTHRPATVDLTGGAPELVPGFRDIVVAARAAGCDVMDRCNLTVLDEPGQEDLAAFLAANRVTIVASMPCYLQQNVDKQRGKGTYTRSIQALQQLNKIGYGTTPELPLHLVYNPGGAALPPAQKQLEADYKARLGADWGVYFHELWCLTNVAITRFKKQLARSGELDAYEALLLQSYQPANLDRVMCRTTLSVDHDGNLYDCDFNLALDLPLGGGQRKLRDVTPAELTDRPIAMGSHCLACTAGSGSSCTGALVG